MEINFVKHMKQILTTVARSKLATIPPKTQDLITVNNLSPFYAHLVCENYQRIIKRLSLSAFFELGYFPNLNACVRKTAIMLSIHTQLDVILVL